MKLHFILILLLSLSGFTKAQVVRIYCYEQPIEGGAQQANDILVSGMGKDQSESASSGRFFLFVEVRKFNPVFFEEVYIKGRFYSFKTDSIKKLPFIIQNSNGGEMILRDTLVRSSKNIIIHIKDLALVNDKTISPVIRKRTTKTNIVIRYKLNKKICVTSSSKIEYLKPLFTQ